MKLLEDQKDLKYNNNYSTKQIYNLKQGEKEFGKKVTKSSFKKMKKIDHCIVFELVWIENFTENEKI